MIQNFYEAFNHYLTEGIYDTGRLKAVFLAGGPGSGKSYVTSQIFGISRDLKMNTMSSSGLKIINTDMAFTHMLKKHGYDPKQLGNLSPDEFESLNTGPESIRQAAKKTTEKLKNSYLRQQLGLIIDGTGANKDFTAGRVEELRKHGYDCFMLFIDTDLETALRRNVRRDRTLPEKLVKEMWHQVQNNKEYFRNLFGDENFEIIENSSDNPFLIIFAIRSGRVAATDARGPRK